MTGSYKEQRYYETIPRIVSTKFVVHFVHQIWISGSPKSESFLGKRRKEWSVYYEFRRNLFKHGISLDVSQVQAIFPEQRKKTIRRALIRNKDTTKQSPGLFLPNLLFTSFTKFGYRGPRKAKAFWGKGERNGVFIMNFAEIYSNTEFLWTCHRFKPYFLNSARKQYDGLL